MRSQLDFIHEFVPGAFNQTLLLLHRTGGNKRDLLPLKGELDLSSVAGLDRRRLRVFVALLWLIADARIEPEAEGFDPMSDGFRSAASPTNLSLWSAVGLLIMHRRLSCRRI
jgi:hypothetical protein